MRYKGENVSIMFRYFIENILLGRGLKKFHGSIRSENRSAVHFLGIAGLLISTANILAQEIVHGVSTPPLYSFILPGVFLVLFLADRFIIPDKYRYSILILYLTESVVLFIATLLGTVFDPVHEAITVLLMMVTVPIFIMDIPLRSMLVTGFWSVIFVILCGRVKDPKLAQIDNVHILEFYIASVILTLIMMRVRLQYLSQLLEVRYAFEHDRPTGLSNREGFYRRINGYLNKPVMIHIAEIQDFTMYGDFYGHEIANEMMKAVADALSEQFGTENTFRYRGNEFLCVLPEINPQKQAQMLESCRKRLSAFTTGEHVIPLSLNVGYVTGTMAAREDASSMIQLADIYLHTSEMEGENRTHGDAYSPENLKEGIIYSNLTVHAHSYEIDAQTGLSGIGYFKIHATDLLNTVADWSKKPVVGYLRLGGLRAFNDVCGYSAGDQLITDTARMMTSAFEERQLCHISSGKFGVLCYQDEVEPAIRQLNDLLALYKPGMDLRITGGFAECIREQSVISLLDQAKEAERVSRKRTERYGFYDTKMDEEVRFRQYIVNHVDEAVEKNYLKIYYQPIINAKTGHICNEEALVRWDDPNYGFLMPGRFIRVLEESALMYKVNLCVVSKVLEGFAERRKLGVPTVPVSVNLSRSDFEQCDMVAAVTSLLDEAGVSHDMICIEITESAFMKDQELLKNEVNRFRENGFQVWMDDFGSEYSTLNLLEEITIDLLKIDMQFMKNFVPGTKNHIIVSSMLDMAHKMGITTLMEGVETEEQYKAMQDMGCDRIQGYFFNRPNPQDYIVKRALSGTGLVFQTPDEIQ